MCVWMMCDSVCVLRGTIPDSLNSSSEAILTDMSWEKRSFWGQANVSGRLLIGSFFSLAPKVLKVSRWEAGGVSSAGGGSTSMGSAFTFTLWYWASLLFSREKTATPGQNNILLNPGLSEKLVILKYK